MRWLMRFSSWFSRILLGPADVAVMGNEGEAALLHAHPIVGGVQAPGLADADHAVAAFLVDANRLVVQAFVDFRAAGVDERVGRSGWWP